MKVALFFLGLVAIGSSAPQPRKVFHEHFDDFLEIIVNEIEEDLHQLWEQYIQYEEFRNTLDFITTSDFKQLIYEMESLPEFKAVIDFLERDNIDILYFLDVFNDAIESMPEISRVRQSVSGNDMSSFMNDAIALFPKEKLGALFDQKMAEDEEFRTAIENLQSEEWAQALEALFENETFHAEYHTLADNGIDIRIFVTEIMAIFGQN